MLGSIFSEMIECDPEKCRTDKIKKTLIMFLSNDAGFSKIKTGNPIKMEVSRSVEPNGEMSNRLLESFQAICNVLTGA